MKSFVYFMCTYGTPAQLSDIQIQWNVYRKSSFQVENSIYVFRVGT